MTGEVESGSAREITIMVVTTAIEFACGFGLVILVVLGLLQTVRGTLTVAELVGFPLCFGLTLATGFKAMMLVCRPTTGGMIGLLLMTAASLVVGIGMIVTA